ncbi:hypothetical protein DENSPDRAFT_671815 [Dentipellis sp. KUC8613]|nr:hypothetical protein DENSPDRAFT_671815 [Dentipellis sp. KUC8613]
MSLPLHVCAVVPTFFEAADARRNLLASPNRAWLSRGGVPAYAYNRTGQWFRPRDIILTVYPCSTPRRSLQLKIIFRNAPHVSTSIHASNFDITCSNLSITITPCCSSGRNMTHGP